MTMIARDVRFGLRLLGKSPGHTLAAVVALTLGIGLSTAMFSVVYGLIFRGLPLDEPERILYLETARPSKDQPSLAVPLRDFLDWRRRQTSFEELAAYYPGTIILTGAGEKGERPAERFDGAFVSSGLLPVLRVRPLLGRGIQPGDEAPGAAPVVVLGWGVWRSRYGGDPHVVGRTVRINGTPGTIAGVMPQGFSFPMLEQAWTNFPLDPLRGSRGYRETVAVIGRLKPEATRAAARAEMEGIARALAAERPDTNEGLDAIVKPLGDEYVPRSIRMMLYVMLACCLFVLLIACTNVASLLMARASRRTRELAVRSALGAQRRTLVRQLLLESLLLSLLGAVPGVLLAGWALDFLNAAIGLMNPPYWVRIALDPASLVFALGLTLLAALVAGLMPALQASRPDITDVLKDEGRGGPALILGRLSRFVVVGELTLSCLLLVFTGLMVKSVIKLRTVELGFDQKDVLTARVPFFETSYPEEADRIAFVDQLVARLHGHPGAQAAATTTMLPGNGGPTSLYTVAGRSYPRPEDRPVTWTASISPGYFDTFRIPLRHGRDFGPLDKAGGLPVLIVSESFARAAWPGQNPLGRQVRLVGEEDEKGEEAEAQPWRTVVGVAADTEISVGTRQAQWTEMVYLPLAQGCPRFVSLAIKTRQGKPEAFTESLRAVVAGLDSDMAAYRISSLEELLARNQFHSNLFAILFAIFGLSALLLASVGIYGVIAFSVEQRTREIGVRLALGARRESVLGLILGQGMRQLAIGLGLGLLLAWPAVRVLRRFLFGVQPNDPATFATVALVLTFIAFAACWFPARRAAATDPLVAIRYD